MNTERLINAIGSIDDRYVLAYTAGAVPRKRKPVTPLFKWSVAACAAVAVALSFLLLPTMTRHHSVMPTPDHTGGQPTPPDFGGQINPLPDAPAATTTKAGGDGFSNNEPATTTTHPHSGKPTGTTTPSKTEPPKTTTTTAVKDKLLITADKSDDYFDSLASEGSNSRYGNYISRALQAKMEQYHDTDALYAVIVRVFVTDEDFFDGEDALGLDETNEEMIRLTEELELARQACLDETLTDDTEQLAHYYTLREACSRLCFELYGNIDEIQDQAVRMRMQETIAWWEYHDASVEYMRRFRLGNLTNDELGTLVVQTNEKRERARDLSSAYSQFRSEMLREYVTPILQQRIDVLTDVCDTKPVQTSSGNLRISYYAELPAEVIKVLAKQGGYAFRLYLPDGSDPEYGVIQ